MNIFVIKEFERTILRTENMASKLFRKALAEVKPETKIFVKKYLDLLERIHELMGEKKMSQKDLADALEQQRHIVNAVSRYDI